MNPVPKAAFEIWGQWLAQSPTESTYKIIGKMHDAIQIGGIPMARRLFEQAGDDTGGVRKAILAMLDHIEKEASKEAVR